MNSVVEKTFLAPGLEISRVLTGLWQIADLERTGKLDSVEMAAQMLPYVQAGFSTFDMADHYGSAEEISGEYEHTFAAKAPASFFTKWVPAPERITKDAVRLAVEERLTRLRRESIDLLQFHAWNYADPNWLDCLFWLQEFQQQGMIQHLGLTNFDATHLEMVLQSGIKVISNQVSYSLIDQRAATDLTDVCQRHNVSLFAYGTVAGGFLSEKWLGADEPDWEKLPNWSLMKYGRFIRSAGSWTAFQNLLQTAQAIAEKHEVSIANIACRYILQKPAVAGIIIGARLGQNAHIESNLRLFEFELDQDDLGAIEAAQSQLARIPGDCGDEYRKEPFLTASGDLSHHLESLPAPFDVKESGENGMMVLSGTPWEKIGGFCRAVRRGNRVWISGTTATHGDKAIGGDDVRSQTHFVIDKIEGVLQSFGASLSAVVRTRIFVKNLEDWEAAARVHGIRFAEILPANTLVQAGLVGDEYLVEMEAEAVLPE